MPRKLVVCCDGTWNTPETDAVTNVVALARAVKPRDGRGDHQVVFYDWGIGTGNFLDRIVGGIAGKGLDRNIRDAYRFLVHNYLPGDRVYLFGFSRGAYTVRSLVGFIRNCGLLKKRHSGRIPEAFEIYRSRRPELHPNAAAAKAFAAAYSRRPSLRFLGVWDTVGALGIPIRSKSRRQRHEFHDTRLSSAVEHAAHALAIDEQRKPFTATIWNTKRGRKNTSQVWFAGAHSDVGGGYEDDHGLADIALVWMADRAEECGLSFDRAILCSGYDRNSEFRVHDSHKRRYGRRRKREPLATSGDESIHGTVRDWIDEEVYAPGNLPPGWRDRVGPD
jgi:uncharacterized protein (DUF2235 family)